MHGGMSRRTRLVDPNLEQLMSLTYSRMNPNTSLMRPAKPGGEICRTKRLRPVIFLDTFGVSALEMSP